eukprot:IDg8292t1
MQDSDEILRVRWKICSTHNASALISERREISPRRRDEPVLHALQGSSSPGVRAHAAPLAEVAIGDALLTTYFLLRNRLKARIPCADGAKRRGICELSAFSSFNDGQAHLPERLLGLVAEHVNSFC